MFNARLLKLASVAMRHVVADVVFRMVSLLAQSCALVWVAHLVAGVMGGSVEPLAPAPLALAVVLALAALAAARHEGRLAGSAAVTTVSKAVFDKLIALGPSFSRTTDGGHASQLVGEGSQRLRPFFESYLPQLFFSVLGPLALFFVVLPMSWPSAVAMLACVPLMPFSIMALMRRAKGFMGQYWGTYVDLSGEFLDAVRGLTTLKGYRADGRWHERLNGRAEEFRRITMRLLRVQMGNVALMDLFTYGGIAVGCAVAAVSCARGSISLADALSVAFLSTSFFSPMRRFGSLFHTGMDANAVADDLFEVLDAVEPDCGSKTCDSEDPSICARGMVVSYDGARPVLEDVDFDLPAHSLVGITGASGSGKSTLVDALTGAFPDYQGSITVCGTELRELSGSALGGAVTVVSQRSHVFRGTIRSNLVLGREGATDEELWGALKNARLDGFVLAQGGLDAEVGEGGANLSGGQRQRLCLARALLRDTPIYVFDEVASNIDATSEHKILEGIEELSVTHTVIMVSHRLVPLAWADRIYVMDAGRIVESGTHQSLVAGGGTYRALWDRMRDLEGLASASKVAYDDEVVELSDAERRMAKVVATHAMPLMGAQTMTAALEALSYRRYLHAPSASLPEGHPSWIPLPDYVAKDAAHATVEKGAASDEPTAPSEPASDPPSRMRGAWQTILGMLALTRGMGREVAGAVLLGTLGNLCVVGQLAAVGGAVARAAGGASVVPWIVAVAVLGLVRAALHYLERLLTHDQTFRTLALVRDRVFGALRRLAPARLVARDAGDLVSLLTSDVESLEGLYSRALAPVLSATVSSLVVVVALWALAPALGLVALTGTLVVGVCLPLLGARLMRERARDLTSYSVLMHSFLLDSLSGIADLLQFGRARSFSDEMGSHMDSLDAGDDSLSWATSVVSALGEVLALVMVVLTGVACASLVHVGAIDGAAAALATLALMAALGPVVSVAGLGLSLPRTLQSANRILDVLSEEPETSEVSAGADVTTGIPSVSVRDVSFAYGDGAEKVLDGVSLEVASGRLLRLTGPSGSGKSTLLRLIMRYWDVRRGSIELSGTDVRSIRTEALRRSECHMEQDTYLLDATLGENLRIVCPDASDADLLAAVEASALEDLVASLPEGLETRVGVHGSGLSDGERQRVGLCRALLSGACLMLLDEPTSNLDSLSEAQVLLSLRASREGRTIVLVSHRSVAAAIADDTYVLERRDS